jgi:hypothetical protein
MTKKQTGKSFTNKFDVELNDEDEDAEYCLFVFELILKTNKRYKYLFGKNGEKEEVSEWDYLLKFWGPVMERLFQLSGNLRLKW